MYFFRREGPNFYQNLDVAHDSVNLSPTFPLVSRNDNLWGPNYTGLHLRQGNLSYIQLWFPWLEVVCFWGLGI